MTRDKAEQLLSAIERASGSDVEQKKLASLMQSVSKAARGEGLRSGLPCSSPAIFSGRDCDRRASWQRRGQINVQVLVDCSGPPRIDDVVRLTYTFSGSGPGAAPGILPLKNLALTTTRNAEQMSFVNGVFSRSLSLTYFLRPQGPGPGRDRRSFVRIRRKDGEGGELPPRGRARAGPRCAGCRTRRERPDLDLPQAARRFTAGPGRRGLGGARPSIEFRVTPNRTQPTWAREDQPCIAGESSRRPTCRASSTSSRRASPAAGRGSSGGPEKLVGYRRRRQQT